MAFDEGLAERLRSVLQDRRDVEEKKMFGGLCLMVRGHMTVGIVKDELMLRVGPDGYEDALAQPHCREMTFTGKPMKGMVYVGVEGFDDDDDLRGWVQRALDFNATQPVKVKKPKAKAKKKPAAKKI